MGFQTKEQKNYVSIVQGTSNGQPHPVFAQRVAEGTPGSVKRTLKPELGQTVGKEVTEIHDKEFIGYIVNITKEDGKFGLQWVFTLKDNVDDTLYCLQTNIKDNSGCRILKCLPNIDIAKVVLFSLAKDDEGNTVIFIKQANEDGEFVTIKQKFTKLEPNGCPEWKLLKVNGKDTWDRGDEFDFLEKVASEMFTGQSVIIDNTESDKTLEETHGDLLATEADAQGVPFL